MAYNISKIIMSIPSRSPKTAPNSGKHWSNDHLRMFAQMHLSNEPIQKIADVLGRTPKAIINQLGDAEALLTGTGERLSNFLNHAKAKISEKPTNHRARWTTDQDLVLVVGFSKGLAASELAKELKRTKFAVIGRLHTLGLLSFDKDTMTYFTKPQHYYTIKKAQTP